jgi:NADH pyrophosphatase NudC (nudix superfamily)
MATKIKGKQGKQGKLVKHETDLFYNCTCGGKPKYVESEWKWRCPDCGAKNY